MATMTFYDAMIITNDNGEVRTVSFTDNMDILEDALEQVAPEPLGDIREDYENELDEAYENELDGDETWSDPHLGYIKRIKELVQRNWNVIYPIVADDLK